ncbi:hypothetical protein V6N11_025641 [Hibiscus sabdariffa]|uniref:Uncharacterized protein n=1 Tax=Hibiscus sabdariffa TaxID=183260 RepID=A0ABR2ST66_9ROSI
MVTEAINTTENEQPLTTKNIINTYIIAAQKRRSLPEAERSPEHHRRIGTSSETEQSKTEAGAKRQWSEIDGGRSWNSGGQRSRMMVGEQRTVAVGDPERIWYDGLCGGQEVVLDVHRV